eukprot:5566789-Pyramimonas_sp.AAC.1
MQTNATTAIDVLVTVGKNIEHVPAADDILQQDEVLKAPDFFNDEDGTHRADASRSVKCVIAQC